VIGVCGLVAKLLVMAALAACERGPRTTSNKEASMSAHTGNRPTQAPAALDREIEVSHAGGSARLRVTLPASWTTEATSIVLRDEYQEAIAGIQFTVICDAQCSDDDIARLPHAVDEAIAARARPNVGTGDPEMDAVRLDVADVERAVVPGGHVRVVRVTRPAGLEGPYREQLYAVCARAKLGAKAVIAQAWAPLAREGELGPVITHACKTFEIR